MRRLVEGIFYCSWLFGVSKSIELGGGVVKLVVITLRQMSGITIPTFWRASLARRVWLAGSSLFAPLTVNSQSSSHGLT
jgi:hypothetical protein